MFISDINKLQNDFDNQMRIWVSQLIENSLETRPTRIEVRFIKMGLEGFDIIDNGVGI
jgi:hypothetical protein